MSERKSYQVAIIGSGAGGKKAAILAARNGLRVVLVEEGALGGTTFDRGYYSVRAFRASAEAAKERSQAGWPDWFRARRQVRAWLTQNLENTLDKAGVEVRFGRGSLADGDTICLEKASGEPELIRAEYIILATGSRPEFDGQNIGPNFVNSDQLLNRTELPKRLLIVGGGYLGCELASVYRFLRCDVTLIEKRERLLPDWDEFVSAFIAQKLRSSGVSLHLGQELDLLHPGGTNAEPSFTIEGQSSISPDVVLAATGRRPNIENLGLENLGIAADPFIRVDESLRTSVPNVFAIGDVNGLGLLDSVAVAQARVAVGVILGKKIRFSQRWVPRCAHTDPPVASVGWTEEEAGRAGLSAVACTETFHLVTDDEKSVLEPVPIALKILVDAESRQVLGVHAIGRHAAELVNMAAVAIRSGMTIEELSEITFVHPSLAETIQECLPKLGSITAG
jgi:pyruvate/2-oxoglutarate dehydrogenase complex dihydrolipoamide dehydrogenase (E3) component